jgi:tetratricopeptide (TPR) repeat protein
MALDWVGAGTDAETLTREVYTAKLEGSLALSLVTAARRQGTVAYPIGSMDELSTEVAAGHPVIVLQNLALAWLPRWHYALVVGYDLDEGAVVLHSGRTASRTVSLETFRRTWARADEWGLLVLAPGTLPASGTERSYLEAVVGLEQTDDWAAAARCYQAALERWPRSVLASVALGNARYRLGEIEEAESAYRRAVAVDPSYAPAYNNLAHVLAELGRHREATVAARTAIDLGGPFSAAYQRTLEEIATPLP